MAITYTWTVKSLRVQNVPGGSGFVVQTYWTKTGTDENGNTGTFEGATPFSPDDVQPGQTVVPLEQLTEEMVIGWIQAVVVGRYKEHVNGVIAKQIADKANPVVDAQMPWAPVVEAAPEAPAAE